jgi:hypothetical protein
MANNNAPSSYNNAAMQSDLLCRQWMRAHIHNLHIFWKLAVNKEVVNCNLQLAIGRNTGQTLGCDSAINRLCCLEMNRTDT